LVDSAYGCYKGFLPPYRHERFHLENFRRGRPQPRNGKELFNYRHSSLRSTVEQMFRILKNRFPILENMPSYAILDQRLLVVACCTIHNFIRKDYGDIDPLFRHAIQQLYGEAWINISQRVNMPGETHVTPGLRPDQSQSSAQYMGAYRNTMKNSMWDWVHRA
jgi:hypothetical protein